VLWLDAADIAAEQTAVGTWADKSRPSLRAVQTDPARQPKRVERAINGRPALRFDGDDFLNLGQPATLDFRPGTAFTIAVVYHVAASRFGTFIAKGGGTPAQRAYQFYVNTHGVGAITYGAQRETRAQRGVNLAMLTCDGSRSRVYVNGDEVMAFAAGRSSSNVDVLIGARRKGADNTGTYYPFTGDIAEIQVYNRALTDVDRDRVGSYLWEKYALRGRYGEVDVGQGLDAAERLWRIAQRNRLTSSLAELAAKLLQHDDSFVRGLAEWAISLKVGGENSGQEVVWPRPDPPGWFAAWRRVPPTALLEADWVRQAVTQDLHRDAKKLRASIAAMCARVERMSADSQSSATMRSMRTRAAEAPDDLPRLRQLWIEARRHLRQIVLASPALAFDRLVLVKQFAPHTVRNITRSYSWKHKPGGDVCVLSGLRPDGKVRGLIDGRLGPGFVWGLDLWWDGDRVVFGYAKQPTWPPPVNTSSAREEGTNVFKLRQIYPPMHIFEVDADGSDLRQLTDHPYWNDFEPTYCANGDVVFASDRCGRSAECGNEKYDHSNPNLYVMSPDGTSVRQFTDNKDIDRYPHTLDNGLVAYTHWEYQERHFMEVHALWTARPDGTLSDALFKHHLRAPCGLRDTRSIPGSSKLVSTATGHHTFAWGPVVIVDPGVGLNSDRGISIVTPGVRVQEGRMAGQPVSEGGVLDRGGLYQTPWALSEKCFLASYSYPRPNCEASGGADSNGFAIYLIDVYGNRELIYRDQLLSCTFPIPLRKRPRPPIVPDIRATPGEPATCYVTDVYDGLTGVPRGTIKHLRIAQHVGWPLDAKRGAMHYIPGSAGAKHLAFQSWSPVRVIGTVPVERDGSAHFTVPPDTALYFQALDERHMEVRRMRSMVSLKTAEVRGCTGCHETRAHAPAARSAVPLALRHPPVTPTPPPWGAHQLLGYEWLVQPILDRHCVRCHGADKPEAGLDLTGRRATDGLYQSFRTLLGARKRGPRLVSTSNRFSNADVTKPKQFGSHRSRLIQMLLNDESHQRQVRLNESEWLSLVTWIDANAPYYDAFVNKRPTHGRASRNVAPMFAAQASNGANLR